MRQINVDRRAGWLVFSLDQLSDRNRGCTSRTLALFRRPRLQDPARWGGSRGLGPAERIVPTSVRIAGKVVIMNVSHPMPPLDRLVKLQSALQALRSTPRYSAIRTAFGGKLATRLSMKKALDRNWSNPCTGPIHVHFLLRAKSVVKRRHSSSVGARRLRSRK